VIVDAPGFAACLLAWEHPGPTAPGDPGDRDRRFEAIWTLDARAARRAARTAARMTAAVDPVLGGRIDGLLADRPLALEQPAPSLTALANRVVAYLEPLGIRRRRRIRPGGRWDFGDERSASLAPRQARRYVWRARRRRSRLSTAHRGTGRTTRARAASAPPRQGVSRSLGGGRNATQRCAPHRFASVGRCGRCRRRPGPR
jgi:hypothetical protein